MLFWKYLFWVSCFVVFYNYAGYAVVIFFLNKLRSKKKPILKEYYPGVSFIVAAYNEEDCIEQKIINSLEQFYPKDDIEFIFITDGSTDATPNIISRYSSNIKLLHSDDRKGKTAALNRAVEAAKNEILIFSDANTLLNKHACENISRHYYDKAVGGVAGEKKVLYINNSYENTTSSEGFYWKYESFLKKLDSDFYSVVGAAGELFSVRKDLYSPVSSKVILDDFVISMKIAQDGYRIIYEPNAFATELPSASMQDERKRKVRIAAGGFQAIAMLPQALFFWKHPKLSFLYISHRVLRWTLTPICLILTLVSSLVLTIFDPFSIYLFLFAAQALFYLSAITYWLYPSFGQRVLLLRLAYYFSFMNISVVEGFSKFIQKKQSSTWEKAKRTNYELTEASN